MKIALISAPYDSGYHKERLGFGPTVLMETLSNGLMDSKLTVRKEEISIATGFSTEVTTSFEVSRHVSRHVREALTRDEFPIVFTGNCNSAAVGTLSGIAEEVGVIWFDCHGDFNTPDTTLGGYFDGMSISIITGETWKTMAASLDGFRPIEEKNIILVGARDLDPLEQKRLSSSEIKLITPAELKRNENVISKNLIGTQSVYLHIDLDVLDPSFVKVNTYCTDGGLLPEQLCANIKSIKENYRIAAVAFTAYDPALDLERKIPLLVNQLVKIIIGK
jgi:arginase